MTEQVLTPFDGKDVRATTVKITNAGDGLSKALKIDPRELHHREQVYVVLECTVSGVQFVPISDDTEDLMRVHVLKAGTSTIVDRSLVEDVLKAQQVKLDEAKGITQIPYPDSADPDDDGDPDAEADDELGTVQSIAGRRGGGSA